MNYRIGCESPGSAASVARGSIGVDRRDGVFHGFVCLFGDCLEIE